MIAGSSNSGLRGGQSFGGIETLMNVMGPSILSPRLLNEADVDLYGFGSPGTCQIRNSLDTLYTGQEVAFGAVFTVKALTDSIDVEGFEFANIESNADLQVKIYARQGTAFSSDPSDWIELSSTTSVSSPDGLGAIAPRADMERSVSFNQNDEWIFYLRLDSGHLKMAETDISSGSSYQADEFLQLNVGESVGDGAEFLTPQTANRAFQGKIHYRVLTPCTALGTETTLIFPFAAAPGTDRRDLNTAVSDGFEKFLTEEAHLARLNQVHGLNIIGITLKSKGSLDDCTIHGFDAGCEIYDTDLQLRHFESLDSRELRLEFMLNLNNQGGFGELENELNVVYIGDEVFEQQYDIVFSGVPFGTVLNPIQRSYLESITYDFLDEYSDAEPHRVEIRQSVSETRRLRGQLQIESRSNPNRSNDERLLQERGFVRAEAVVYGVGDDFREFLSDLEIAFVDNTEQYKEEVQKQQYLPNEVNDRKNLGEVFSGIRGIEVSRAGSNDILVSVGETSEEGLTSDDIQIIVFSIVAGLSFFWLLYRFMKDCVLVKNGWAIRNEKLSDKIEREKEEQDDFHPELDNMDKPRQKPSKDMMDISNLEKLPKTISAADLTGDNTRRGRKPPSSRGVGRNKSSDDVDFFAIQPTASSSEHRREPKRGVNRAKSSDMTSFGGRPSSSTTEPMRGVSRTKSADTDLSFRMSNPVSSRSAHSRDEPKNLGRIRRHDALNRFDTTEPMSIRSLHSRPGQPSKGIGRSKSSDGADFFAKPTRRAPNLHRGGTTSSQHGRAEPTRGLNKSNTFSGVEGFMGKNSGQDQETPAFLFGRGSNGNIDKSPPLPIRRKEDGIRAAKSNLTHGNGSTGINKETQLKKKKTKTAGKNGASPSTKPRRKGSAPNSSDISVSSELKSGTSQPLSLRSQTSSGSKGSRSSKSQKPMRRSTAVVGDTPKKKTKSSNKNKSAGHISTSGVPFERPPRPPRVDMAGPNF